MHIRAIINPAAGNGHAKKVGKELAALLENSNVPHSIVYTEYPGHGTELAVQAVAEGITTVLAVGGDGTAFEIACGLLYSDTSLGIIAAGTGNDYIKSLNLPKATVDALDVVLTHPPRAVDVGTINDKVFMNVCGTGFDVTVLDYAEPVKKYCKGIFPYFIGLIRTVLHYKPVHITLITDGVEQFTKDILVCAVANGKYIGGGMPIAPMAVPDDGVFDVLVVEHVSKPKIVSCLPKFLKGRIMDIKEATHIRAEEVILHSPAMRVQIDGEIFPMQEARFRVMKDAIKLHW